MLVSTHNRSLSRFVHHSKVSSYSLCHQCNHSVCCSLTNNLIFASNSSASLRTKHNVPWNLCFSLIRGYAKGKDRGREKKKTDKGKKKIDVSDEQLAEVIKVDSLRTQMQKAIDRMKEEYVRNLSLRSTTGSIETLSVNFEGKEYELQELAQIVRKNPKTIIVNMTAFPQTIPATLEAIAKSGMNLNPQQDGTTLFIPVPKVTKEHRENLAKSAKALFVKCKDSIREVQNKFVRNVKNNTNISQDLAYNVQEQIIALGDQYVSEGEKIYEAKHTELIGKE
ncbi:ribosome-recycling factor, mitochondrial isoform X2 [Periplaneta americana]